MDNSHYKLQAILAKFIIKFVLHRCYEYRFMESMTENSRSVFFKAVKPHEHIPMLQDKNKKTVLHVVFRPGKVRYDPMSGRCIQQMLYPFLAFMEKPEVKTSGEPRVFKKYYNL